MNEMGVAEFYKGSWETKGHEVVNRIGCADCHDAEDHGTCRFPGLP